MLVSGPVDCKWAQLLVLGAVVVPLTPFGSHVGHECAKSHGVNSISGFSLTWFLNALSHLM